MIRRIIHKLVSFVRRKFLTEYQLSQLLVEQIRKGGGHVGENVHILASSIDMATPYLISIGNNVTLTTMLLLTHDVSTMKSLGYTKVGRVTIGNDVFVGAKSVILPDTKIGNKVIVGAGTIVSRDIPDNSVVCGSPCRVICSYDDYMNRMKQKMGQYPVIDLLPAELLTEESYSQRQSLIEAGYGFIK